MNLSIKNTEIEVIPFNGVELLSKKIDNIIWVALKPIVEGMGLDWKRQSQKVQSDNRYVVINTPFETKGGIQEMLSLNAYHLPAFLYSINPNKVRKDLRDRIISFQNETFKVINEYWNKKTDFISKSFQGKSVIHTINGLKSGIAVKDKRIAQLEDRIQSLSSENEKLKINSIKANDNTDIEISEKMIYTKEDVVNLLSKGARYDRLLQDYYKIYDKYDSICITLRLAYPQIQALSTQMERMQVHIPK